jgi:imidazoleglycerol phosphate synthase glutamine amidotransferase subunit HisH
MNSGHYYFVHSYYAKPQNEKDVMGITRFGDLEFASAVKKDNVTGTQFHPEKSGAAGLDLLSAFCKMV